MAERLSCWSGLASLMTAYVSLGLRKRLQSGPVFRCAYENKTKFIFIEPESISDVVVFRDFAKCFHPLRCCDQFRPIYMGRLLFRNSMK